MRKMNLGLGLAVFFILDSQVSTDCRCDGGPNGNEGDDSCPRVLSDYVQDHFLAFNAFEMTG